MENIRPGISGDKVQITLKPVAEWLTEEGRILVNV